MRTATRAAAWALAVGAVACTAPPVMTNQPLDVKAERVAPYEQRELCADAQVGDRIDYRFNATEPVAFSIGYRERGATLLPWSRDPTLSDAGIFPVLYPQRYCLTWQAGAAGAFLDYRVVLRRGER